MSAKHEFRRNIRTSVWISLLSSGGKLAAVLKTIAIASVFGVSGHLDAFWVATAIPNVLPIIAKSAFVTSFVPFFMRRAGSADEAALWRAANVLFTIVLVISVGATVLFWWRADWLIALLAPGLEPEVARTAEELMKITVFSLLLIVLTSVLTAVSHCRQRFLAASLDSVTCNVTVIALIYAYGRESGVRALAIATVAGFALQLAVMIHACRRELRDHLRLSFALRLPLFRDYLRGVWPVLVGALSGIAMGMITQALVSYQNPGGVSIFYYASMISMLPIEVIAGSVQATFFPTIAKYADGDKQVVVQAHALAARLLVFVLVPISAMLIAMDDDVVRVLLGYGRFSEQSVHDTGIILACLSLGIVGRALAYFNFQVLHAMGHSWTQVIVGLVQLVMNATLGYLAMGPFGLPGIAAAASFSLLLSVGISYAALVRILDRRLVDEVWKSMLTSVLIGAVAYGVVRALLAVADLQAHAGGRLGYALLVCAVAALGGLVFLLMAALMRMNEARYILGRLQRLIPALGRV